MTLGRKHLLLMVPLFGAAMAYNVWYFSRAESALTQMAPQPQEQPAENSAAGPSVGGAAPPVDPRQIPAPPDVALDRTPVWNRNPFLTPTAPVSASAPAGEAGPVASAAAQPEAPPDIVVSAIVIADRPRARVNGRNMYVGDRVGAATIVEILPRAIVVESPREGRRTIPQQRRPAAPVEAARP